MYTCYLTDAMVFRPGVDAQKPSTKSKYSIVIRRCVVLKILRHIVKDISGDSNIVSSFRLSNVYAD